jgi:hypothetical protein
MIIEPLAALGFLASFVGVVLAWDSLTLDGRRRRLLGRARRTQIADVRDGTVVKIVGQLSFIGEPLGAPLSGRRCAYYEATVDESSGRAPIQLIRERRGQDFILRDDSGKALVRMDEASAVLVMRDAQFSSGGDADPTAVMTAFLARHGQSSRGLLFAKSLNYREGVLEPGERIAVLGLARWEPDPDPDRGALGYRELPMRLVVQASGRVPLVVTDEPSLTG